MHCPECGAAIVRSLGKRNFPYPVVLLAVLPIGLAILHQASSPIDYHCPDCGLRFARRTGTARFVLRLIILVLLSLVMFVVYSCALLP